MIDLRDMDFWRDPYPTLERERRTGRTSTTQTGEPILLSIADMEFAQTDSHFSTPGLRQLEDIGICDGPFYEWRKTSLAVINGPEHQRLRGYVARAFLPREMDRLRALIQSHTNGLLDAIIEHGETEFIADFADDLPLWTMCRFLGIEEEDRLRIKAFLAGTEEGFSYNMTPQLRQRVEASITALTDYVNGLIDRRKRVPRDDIVSRLLQQRDSGGGPCDADIRALIVNIIGGSVGSTSSALSNSILMFAAHPDQAGLLRNEPGLARAAVEECLRYHPPFRHGRRLVVKSVSAFGLDLKPGDSLFLTRQGANRDPERWDNPGEFDLLRPERRHFSFGYGVHQCLGQAVARTNLQEAIPIILNRLHGLEVDGEVKRVPFCVDERLESLRLRFRPDRPITAQPTA
jgi:cytochrome P450